MFSKCRTHRCLVNGQIFNHLDEYFKSVILRIIGKNVGLSEKLSHIRHNFFRSVYYSILKLLSGSLTKSLTKYSVCLFNIKWALLRDSHLRRSSLDCQRTSLDRPGLTVNFVNSALMQFFLQTLFFLKYFRMSMWLRNFQLTTVKFNFMMIHLSSWYFLHQ